MLRATMTLSDESGTVVRSDSIVTTGADVALYPWSM